MKGMRGKLFRKLKSVPTFSTLKQGLVHQLSPSEKFSNQHCQTPLPLVYKEQDQKSNNLSELLFGSTGACEGDKHSKDEEMEYDFSVGNKDTITSPIKSIDTVPAMENPEVPILSDIIMEHEATEDNEEYPSLSDFEENCPPGGSELVIFYTTSMRGIRKTFEDCNSIRFLLESFKVTFYERDVSMHLEYREELCASGASMEEALKATKILAEDCRNRGTAFRLGAVLRDVLDKFLPDDVHIRSTGRVRGFAKEEYYVCTL